MLLAQLQNALSPLAQVPPEDGTWDWFHPSASTVAEDIDNLFWGITWVNMVFFVLIVGLMLLFMFQYRKRPGHKAEHSPHHNNLIEAVWSIIPLLIVVVIFAYGFVGYMRLRLPPEDAYVVQVQAQKWAWSFTYPSGVVDSDLHVPVDRPVKLVLSSADVIHSLYIPAFRVKMDCVPGRYNTMWFEATAPSTAVDANGNGRQDTGEGGYDLFCTEYCGTGHSTMLAKVFVYESEAEFATWVKNKKDPRLQGTPVEVGAKLYAKRGCAQCHSIDGTDRPANGGPSFKGHWGNTNLFTNGSEVKMDENYIRESILQPQKLVRKGYKPIMPTYQGQFSDDELFAIIAYIKHLNDADVPDWLPLPNAEGEPADETAKPEASEPEAPEPKNPQPKNPVTEDPAPADAEPTDDAETPVASEV